MSDAFWNYFFQFLTAIGVAYVALLARAAAAKAAEVEEKVDANTHLTTSISKKVDENTEVTTKAASYAAQAIDEVQRDGAERKEKLEEVARSTNGIVNQRVSEAFERGRLEGREEGERKAMEKIDIIVATAIEKERARVAALKNPPQ